MKNNKKYLFLFLGLISLVLSLFGACVKTGFVTYTNDQFGYKILYPYTSKVEVSEDGAKCLIISRNKRASVMIDVTENLTAEEAAQRWLMSIGSAWGEVVKLEDKPMEGFWDWYLSYDYETNLAETFHGEAYFKQTDSHLYKLDTAALKQDYSDYPFNTMISSFRLK